MSEYEITVYRDCTIDDLRVVLQLYKQVLLRLGVLDDEVKGWLQTISWPADEGGFVSEGPHVVLSYPGPDGENLRAQALALGYTYPAVPSLTARWVEFSLVFEYEADVMEVETGLGFSLEYRYRAGIGKSICLIMREFARMFDTCPVYFNDAPSVNQPWSALLGKQGNLWGFDLALIPSDQAALFEPLPPNYVRVTLPEGEGLTRTDRWLTVPWTEIGVPAT